MAVITGASSGIGRATALEFARRGAAVVVAARREAPLRSLAIECEGAGGTATAIPTDVGDAAAVARLAEAALTRHGRVDVWVNNAAVTLFSRFGEEPVDEVERVLDVNVGGYLHGAREALRCFRARGRGLLVNVGSVLSCVPGAYQAGYSTSKFAVRGLSASLRAEVIEAPRIGVTTVLPGSVDTPLFDHAANRTGWALQSMRPAAAPERVAATIVRCARRRRPPREVFVGWRPRLLAVAYGLVPGLVERLTAPAVRRGHFSDRPAEPTSGNLFAPVAAGDTAAGGWRGGSSPVARRVAVAGAATLVTLAICRR